VIDAETVTLLRAKYRALVVKWDEARDAPKEANQLFDALHALYKELRKTEEGRLAIMGLLDDPITAVQLSAASHSLALQPELAVAVLEELEHGGSLYAVTAKWTLRSYRNGKLDLDW
jgi:hypothetical protein